MDLDVAVEGLLRVLETQVAFAAAEERHEDLAEVFAHLRERREEELARRRVDFPDRLRELLLRVGEVGALPGEKVEALDCLLVLLDGERVHGAELLELLAHGIALGAQGSLVQIDRRGRREQLVERAAPLGLESLADRGAPSGQLRVPELGVMQLLGGASTTATRLL